MSGLFLSFAVSAGTIAGLVVAGVVPSNKIVCGLAATGIAVIIIFVVSSLIPREEDSAPEIRPPQYRTGPLSLRALGRRVAGVGKEKNAS